MVGALVETGGLVLGPVIVDFGKLAAGVKAALGVLLVVQLGVAEELVVRELVAVLVVALVVVLATAAVVVVAVTPFEQAAVGTVQLVEVVVLFVDYFAGQLPGFVVDSAANSIADFVGL